jgi:hypothetical protein
MSNLDIVGAMRLDRLESSREDGSLFAVYKTAITIIVPVPADFDVNDIDKSAVALKMAKQGAADAVYGNLVEDLLTLRQNLPKTHHQKINKLIKQYLIE